jgi:hypothetical protein
MPFLPLLAIWNFFKFFAFEFTGYLSQKSIEGVATG